MANKNAILDALGEAREKLILNKYNEAMMLMAQITIDVIEHLTDEALVVSKGYEEDLKTIKSIGVIGDDTSHNFETLIISGVQAHNGVDIPKEHAEKALEAKCAFITQNENGPLHLDLNLTRAKFEELNMDLFDSTMEPVRKALSDAKLSAEDIDTAFSGNQGMKGPLEGPLKMMDFIHQVDSLKILKCL